MGKIFLPTRGFEKEKQTILTQNDISLEELLTCFEGSKEETFNASPIRTIIETLLGVEYFLTDNYDNIGSLCLFVKQLLSGKISADLSAFTAVLRACDYSERCGVVWTNNYYAYRCRTCGLSVSMSLCEDCFTAGNHKGHDYNKFRSCAGGACDCGDVNVLSTVGFCPHHGADKVSRRPTPPPDLTFRMRVVLRLLLRGLMACLWSMPGPHFFTITDNITSNGEELHPPFPQSTKKSEHDPQTSQKAVDDSVMATSHSIVSIHTDEHSGVRNRAFFSAKETLSLEQFRENWGKLRNIFDLLQQLHSMGWLAQEVISAILLDKEDFRDFMQRMDGSVMFKLYQGAMQFYKSLVQYKTMPPDSLEHVCLMDTYIFALLPLNFPEELAVLLIGLLTIAHYKHAFMYSFVNHYTRISMLLLKHYTEPRIFKTYMLTYPVVMKDRIVHISVQLFSGESWAYELVQKKRLHYVIASCLLVCLDDCCMPLSQHRVINLNKSFLYDTGFWPMVSDFINIVAHESVVKLCCQDARFLQLWFQIVKRLQYTDLYHRRDTHVQRGRLIRSKYLTSYTMELELSDNTMWNIWTHLIKQQNKNECELYFKNLLAVIFPHVMQFNGRKLQFQIYSRGEGRNESETVVPPTQDVTTIVVPVVQPQIQLEQENEAVMADVDLDALESDDDNDMQIDPEAILEGAAELGVEAMTPEEAFFFTLEQATLLGGEDNSDATMPVNSSQLGGQPTPPYHVTTYPWHDIVSFHVPLFRQCALFWSVLHVWHNCSVSELRQKFYTCFKSGGFATNPAMEGVSFEEIMEIWLKQAMRPVLGAGEVVSNMWIYNGEDIQRTHIYYRNQRYAHSLSDLDIVGVQMLASCLPSDRILQALRHDRCLLYGIEWDTLDYKNNTTLPMDKAREGIRNWLFVLLVLTDTRIFWTKSEKGGCVRKELICCLASKPRKRSALSSRMPELPGLNQPFGMESDAEAEALLVEMANYTPPYHDPHTGALHSGVYTIKPAILVEEFDALFQLLRNPDRREYSCALQNFWKACGQEMQLEATNDLWPPLHLPPELPADMSSLEDVLLDEALLSMIFRMLHWYLHPAVNLITEEALMYIVHMLRRCIFRGMEKAELLTQQSGVSKLPWSKHPLRFLSRKRHIPAKDALPKCASQAAMTGTHLNTSSEGVDKDSLCSLLIKVHACLFTMSPTPKFTLDSVIKYRAPCSAGRCTTAPLENVHYTLFKSHFIGTGTQHVSRLLDLLYWSHEELANRVCKSLIFLGIPESEVYFGFLLPKEPTSLGTASSHVQSSPTSSTGGEKCETGGLKDINSVADAEKEQKKREAKERQNKILQRMAEQQKIFLTKFPGSPKDESTSPSNRMLETEEDAVVEETKAFSHVVTCAICQVDVDVARRVSSTSETVDDMTVLSRRFANSFCDLYRNEPDVRELTPEFLANVNSMPPVDTRLWHVFQLLSMRTPVNIVITSRESPAHDRPRTDSRSPTSMASVAANLPPIPPAHSPMQENSSVLLLPHGHPSTFKSIAGRLLYNAIEGSLSEALRRSVIATPNMMNTGESSNNLGPSQVIRVQTVPAIKSQVLEQITQTEPGHLHPGSPVNGMFPHIRTHAAWYICGHHAHFKCFSRYQRHIERTLNDPFQPDPYQRDVVCPLCRRPVKYYEPVAEMPAVYYPAEAVWLACEPWGAPKHSAMLEANDLDELKNSTTCDVFESYFIAIRPIVQQIECELACVLLYPDEVKRMEKKCSWVQLVYHSCEVISRFVSKQCRKMPLLSILYALDDTKPDRLAKLMGSLVPDTSLLTLDPVDVFLFSLTFDLPCKRTFYRSLERSYTLALLRAIYDIVSRFSGADRHNCAALRGNQSAGLLEQLVVEILAHVPPPLPSSESSDTPRSREEVMSAVSVELQMRVLRLLRVAAQCLSHGRWFPFWCNEHKFDDPGRLPDPALIQVGRLPLSFTETVDKGVWDPREMPGLQGFELLHDRGDAEEVNAELVYLADYLEIRDPAECAGRSSTVVDPVQLLLVEPRKLIGHVAVLAQPLASFDRRHVNMALSIGSELFPPRLVTLPPTFDEIFHPLHRLLCPRNKHPSPEYSFLCLHCGHLVCRQCTVPCVNILESEQPLPELFQHAIDCCGHWGVYLNICTSMVWAVHECESARWGAVHLDAFGEEDISLLRGKPLYLNKARYDLLEKQWICNDFRNQLKYWTPLLPTLENINSM